MEAGDRVGAWDRASANQWGLGASTRVDLDGTCALLTELSTGQTAAVRDVGTLGRLLAHAANCERQGNYHWMNSAERSLLRSAESTSLNQSSQEQAGVSSAAHDKPPKDGQ